MGHANNEKRKKTNNRRNKVKLATIVEGNPRAPFSIATTPRCRGGRYSLELPNQERVRTLRGNENYKYFRILEADERKSKKIKKIKKTISDEREYFLKLETL